MSGQTKAFPVTHSVLSAEALLSEVAAAFDIGHPLGCRLLRRGLNDTYRVSTPRDGYVLRIYRTGWRTPADVQYELELLAHMREQQVPVSFAVSCRAGALVVTLPAPEGPRMAALFTLAPGRPLPFDPLHGRRFGEAVARMHEATAGFAGGSRFRIDEKYLLDGPSAALRPLLVHRPADWSFLSDIAARCRDRLRDLACEGLEMGVCHGDTHGANAHIDEDGIITLFDFDCCGPGWPIYDLAVYRWHAERKEPGSGVWRAFLDGYSRMRTPSPTDLAAVPLLVAARQIWVMGLHAANGPDWGYGWLDDAYFDKAMRFLRDWEARMQRDPRND